MITLEEINDLLIDFLPYEIDDDYIKTLLEDIAKAKILKKKDIPFYKSFNYYEIIDDKLGIEIIRKMISYYKEKDRNLSLNASVVLSYLNNYKYYYDMDEKINDLEKFILEYTYQDCSKNYLDYVIKKCDTLRKKRVTDKDFDYEKERNLNKFEQYCAKEADICLEDAKAIFDVATKKNDTFDLLGQNLGVSVASYTNKWYQLNEIFSKMDLGLVDEDNRCQSYGLILNILPNYLSLNKTLELLAKDFSKDFDMQERYSRLISRFLKCRKELNNLISELNLSNYKEGIKNIQDIFQVNLSVICNNFYLDKEVKKKVKVLKDEEILKNRIDIALKNIEVYLEGDLSLKEYLEVMDITYYQFSEYLKLLSKSGEKTIVDSVKFKYLNDYEITTSDLPELIKDTSSKIENQQFNLLEYYLKTKLSLNELVAVALKTNYNSKAMVINQYLKTHENIFLPYQEKDYVDHYWLNGEVFAKDKSDYMINYLKKEEIPAIVGTVTPIINKILRKEPLPHRNRDSFKKSC